MNEDTTPLDLLDIPPLDLDPGDGTGPLWWVLVVLLIAGGPTLVGVSSSDQTAQAAGTRCRGPAKLREAWALLGTPALFTEAVADILRVYLEERFKATPPNAPPRSF